MATTEHASSGRGEARLVTRQLPGPLLGGETARLPLLAIMKPQRPLAGRHWGTPGHGRRGSPLTGRV